jgi:hypothetical protein
VAVRLTQRRMEWEVVVGGGQVRNWKEVAVACYTGSPDVCKLQFFVKSQ